MGKKWGASMRRVPASGDGCRDAIHRRGRRGSSAFEPRASVLCRLRRDLLGHGQQRTSCLATVPYAPKMQPVQPCPAGAEQVSLGECTHTSPVCKLQHHTAPHRQRIVVKGHSAGWDKKEIRRTLSPLVVFSTASGGLRTNRHVATCHDTAGLAP